ncbi:hypothetical protein [Streptomyces sp. NPDC046821]|uniref:hypothetical protein n=1 Tax=Streptomyces sp. NPDC046821 TaxID=3154702 RepID=UPI003411E30B
MRTSAPRRRRPTAPTPQPVQYGPTTYVRPYYRSDGTRVRGHHRTISPRTVAVAAGMSGAGIVILMLILLALGGSGSDASTKPAGTPSHSATPSATHR